MNESIHNLQQCRSMRVVRAAMVQCVPALDGNVGVSRYEFMDIVGKGWDASVKLCYIVACLWLEACGLAEQVVSAQFIEPSIVEPVSWTCAKIYAAYATRRWT